MREIAQRSSKILITLRERSLLQGRRNKEKISRPKKRTGSMNQTQMMMESLGTLVSWPMWRKGIESSSHGSGDEEEVRSNYDSKMIDKMKEMQYKILDLTNKLKSEKNLVKKFREESAIYKSPVEDMEECMRQDKEASDFKVKNVNLSLTELQRTHDTLISVHEYFKIKFHMLSKERVELFQKNQRA